MCISILVIIISTLALVLNTVFQSEDNSIVENDCKGSNDSININSTGGSTTCVASIIQESDLDIFTYTEAVCVGKNLKFVFLFFSINKLNSLNCTKFAKVAIFQLN